MPDKTDGAVENIGPYTFIQPKSGQKITSDSILLAEFSLPLEKNDTVIDLGTGCAIIPLILCHRSGVKKIVGVEIDEISAGCARKNVRANGLEKRAEIIKIDWRELKRIYPPGSFSVIVSNPPYIKRGEGRVSPVRQRAVSRYETFGALSDLVDVSKYLAGSKGRIFYIYPVLRFPEVLSEFRKNNLIPGRITFVHTGKSKDARLFLVEAGETGTFRTGPAVFI